VIRSAVDKVMWMGRATVFLVGLVVILALMFGVVNMVLGANGGPSLSGDSNRIDPITLLVGSDARGDQALALEPLARQRQIDFPRGYAQVNVTAATVSLSGAKGINGVQRSTTENSVYCFDLTFAPRTAVASAHINNNATVGTGLGDSVPTGCPTGFKDAAARTYAANTSAPNSEINFRIVFN
jgi:hypothetical protein